jgi:hypothetical protein
MIPKTYIGRRHPEGCAVIVQPLNADPYPLVHIVLHSPTGIEWAYGGSGPADLALSILADHFGERPTDRQAMFNTQAWKHHQAFKWAVVAPAPHKGFVLLTSDITLWLAEQATEAA